VVSIEAKPQDVIAAGSFGSWLMQTRASLRGSQGADVPCGDCTGCCTSHYSVQLRPEDGAARSRIPEQLLVRMVGSAPGHLTMRALPDGTCPMLHAGKCSIYADRPQTCLDYDCRIFAAAGIAAGGTDKAVINRRVNQWRFTYATDSDRSAHEAVRAAASFIQLRRSSFPSPVPMSPMGIAVLAIKVYSVFLDASLHTRSDAEIARILIEANRAFDAGDVPA
jgi:Fe-S-cluster containining protein